LANQEDMQQKYMQMQMVEQQIKQLQQQMQTTEQQIMELSITLQALDDIKKVEKGTDILVPLASGIFAKAKLEDNTNLMLNVGAGTTIQKDIPGTKEMLVKQMNEIRNVQEQFTQSIQELNIKAQELQKDLTQVMS